MAKNNNKNTEAQSSCVAANHITEKDGFTHFYLSSPNFEIWGNYPIFPEQPLDEIEGLPVIGCDAPAYLATYGESGTKIVLAGGLYELYTDPHDESDCWYEPQVQGMNAKQVARFVHLFNLFFCRVPVEF